MTINEILELKSLFEERQKQSDLEYKIATWAFEKGRIYNFQQWANEKKCEGAFLITSQFGQSYWFVLIDWYDRGDYYLIIFPENRSGPLIEIHKTEVKIDFKNLLWAYSPSKRDGRNALRKAYFSKFAPGGNVVISFPKEVSEMNSFFEDVFSLATIRLKSDNLEEDEPEVREGFIEGKRVERKHLSRERNPKVIKLAKASFKKKHGRLFCEICGFDFQKIYGAIGEDFIEAHHTLPLDNIEDEIVETKVEDIALLCSNCHKMIHRKRPWLEMDDLKLLLAPSPL